MTAGTKRLCRCSSCSLASYWNCTLAKMQKGTIACCSSLFSSTSLTPSNVPSLCLKVKLSLGFFFGLSVKWSFGCVQFNPSSRDFPHLIYSVWFQVRSGGTPRSWIWTPAATCSCCASCLTWSCPGQVRDRCSRVLKPSCSFYYRYHKSVTCLHKSFSKCTL